MYHDVPRNRHVQVQQHVDATHTACIRRRALRHLFFSREEFSENILNFILQLWVYINSQRTGTAPLREVEDAVGERRRCLVCGPCTPTHVKRPRTQPSSMYSDYYSTAYERGARTVKYCTYVRSISPVERQTGQSSSCTE